MVSLFVNVETDRFNYNKHTDARNMFAFFAWLDLFGGL